MNRSPETEQLIAALRALNPGESTSLFELSRKVGFDVSKEMGKLDSARRVLLSEQTAKIDRAKDVVWRVEDTHVVGRTAPSYRRKAARAARRGSNALYSVQYDALPEPEQKAHNTQLAMLGAVCAALSSHVVRKLRRQDEAPKFLPADAVRNAGK